MTFESDEQQYISLIENILSKGERRGDRTGTGTISTFAPTNLRFDLSSFPLLTTKRVYLRPIFEELMFFIRGQTDATILSEKGVKIWDKNGSREFLDSRGLNYREGDLGPVYGFQWRHFGAEYKGCEHDYTGQGQDQLRQIINSLLNNPTDRRMVMSAWNPSDLDKMALPPCHMFCQFYVSNEKRLSCQLYQRSCDVGLGVPFNIASYALMTMMIAHALGIECGEFVHCMGDAHIYLNHVDQLAEQTKRELRPFPTLKIKKEVLADRSVDSVLAYLESFCFEDFELVGYTPHAKIAMEMSA
ncbi:Thymidylate synthase [Terramyces sp. JEL0728]|nr:Thymidylate synthase [Terramyces sp. JEL0728]